MATPADNALPCPGCRALNAEVRRERRERTLGEGRKDARIRALEIAIDQVLDTEGDDSAFVTAMNVLGDVRARGD